MDKKLPQSEMKVKPGRLFVKLSKSQLPGVGSFYKGSLPHHPCISIEEIADRVVNARTSYRRETLISVFRMMIDEIYNALKDGRNVDFGLGRTELIVSGRFATPLEPFDRKRHTIQINLRPSPRLNQLADFFPVEVTNFNANEPLPNEVSIYPDPYSRQEGREFGVIPNAYSQPLFIHGRRLKVMGDQPGVGLHLCHLPTGATYFIAPNYVFINQANLLCFIPPVPMEAGVWTISIHSQYTPTYHLYKKPRVGSVSLTVLDVTSPG